MKQSNSECSKADWMKPPFHLGHYAIWHNLFSNGGLDKFYEAATRATHPNSISVQRMEKFTQACVVARLKGELK